METVPKFSTLARPALIATAATALICVTVMLGLTLGLKTRTQFREIEASWVEYAGVAERKGALISEIRGFLGYGGIIHHFKNYVLRQEPSYLAETQRQIVQFRHSVQRFEDLPLSDAETAALQTISRTIAQYEDNLIRAVAAAAEGWTPSRTDQVVRVDDSAAIAALGSLEAVWREVQKHSTERIFAAVGQGNTLIWIGFWSLAALLLVSLIIGALLLVLYRELKAAAADLGAELAERRKLEQSQERLATIVEQSPTSIILTDTRARIQYANRKFEDLSGWSRNEVLGQTPSFLQSGQTDDADYKRIEDQLALGEAWHGIFRNLRKDGSSYWVETTLLPLKAPDGTVQNFVGIGEDITEARRARDQVARAQKLEAVGQLAGGVAHDFNNILTTIVGSCHLAGLDAPEGSDIAMEIEQISIAARRAQDLVRELLTFARREPGEPRPVDLNGSIREVARLLRASVSPSIRFSYPAPASTYSVMGDPTHLHQIIMNLCRNAAEALGGAPGDIRITLAECGPPEGCNPNPHGWARLDVIDDGPGMTEDTLKHLFEPFFTTKPIGKGSGLGLAVVFGLVEEIGGRITVETELGRGTRFSVFMRLTGARASVEEQPAEALPRGNERIILIDDEGEVAGTFRRQLARLGYRVEAYTSPIVALERFQANPRRFDMAISDVVMPDMTGDELIQRFRTDWPELPVLFCTGYAPESVSMPGKPPHILRKPVDPADLARQVRAVLDKAQEIKP